MTSKKTSIQKLLASLSDDSYDSRCNTLRELCPCRNNNRELEIWGEIFNRARNGGKRERNQAAHAIGTLIQKAPDSQAWREVLQHHKSDLDRLMKDRRVSGLLLDQMKRHGHAHRGAAIKAYRRHRRDLDLTTPLDLANWVNQQAGLAGSRRVGVNDTGVQRLWRWMKHRVKFQPGRSTGEEELTRMARRYLPQVFA